MKKKKSKFDNQSNLYCLLVEVYYYYFWVYYDVPTYIGVLLYQEQRRAHGYVPNYHLGMYSRTTSCMNLSGVKLKKM